MASANQEAKKHLLFGFALVKRQPWLVLAHAAVSLFSSLLSFVLATVVLIGFALMILSAVGAVHVKPVLAAAGLGGLVATLLLLNLAAKSLVQGAIWDSTAGWIRNDTQRSLGMFVGAAFPSFSTALLFNVLRSVTHALLVCITVTVVLCSFVASRWVALETGSELVLPALVWATSLVLLATYLFLIRLSIEVMPAPLFVDGVSFPEALYRAVSVTLSSAFDLYRIFILAAIILLGALGIQLVTILFQNATIELQGLLFLGSFARFAGEVAVLVGTSLFIVVMHTGFFALYGTRTSTLDPGRLSESPESNPPPDLEELLPDETRHIYDLDTLLAESAPSRPKDADSTGLAPGEEE